MSGVKETGTDITTEELINEIEEVKAAIKEVLAREQMNENECFDVIVHKKKVDGR